MHRRAEQTSTDQGHRRLAAGLGGTDAAARAGHGIRWGESLATSHPQVQMAERVAKEVKEKTGGRLDVQVFANSQLGSGKEMIESTSSGALQLTTDGAGALGAFLPQLGHRGALPVARRRAHGQGRWHAAVRQAERRPGGQARHAHAQHHLLRQAPPHHRQQGGQDARRHGRLQAARAAGRHLPRDGRGLGRARHADRTSASSTWR